MRQIGIAPGISPAQGMGAYVSAQRPTQQRPAQDERAPRQDTQQTGAYGARIDRLFQDAIRDLADIRQPAKPDRE